MTPTEYTGTHVPCLPILRLPPVLGEAALKRYLKKEKEGKLPLKRGGGKQVGRRGTAFSIHWSTGSSLVHLPNGSYSGLFHFRCERSGSI